jgi:hypothetical protein
VYVLELVKELERLEKDRMDLTDLLKKNTAEIMELSRVGRIEQTARSKLGMERAHSENIYTLVVDKREESNKPDDLANMVFSIKKLVDHLPVISESRADTIRILELDED